MKSIQSLKIKSTLVSPLLSHLINKYFTCDKFRDFFFQIACVIPIFKTGGKDIPNNYRPVSILRALNKNYRKVVFNQVLSYLDHFELLKPSQICFRKKTSTSDAILKDTQSFHYC